MCPSRERKIIDGRRYNEKKHPCESDLVVQKTRTLMKKKHEANEHPRNFSSHCGLRKCSKPLSFALLEQAKLI